MPIVYIFLYRECYAEGVIKGAIMANPFRFGQIVDGELFCNRKAEIKQITTDLESGQSIVLYSPRRYGKTSLIKATSKVLKSRKILYL